MNKNKFAGAINTMLYSWGGDTPQEVVWAFNEMMDAFGYKIEMDADLDNCEEANLDFEDTLQKDKSIL